VAITMQGSWTVSVKSKSAAFPQRFVIAGAATGNGVHAGDVGTPPVFVSAFPGQGWSITVQNNPGSGFVNSDDRIKFPTNTGGQYKFDIETNDAGADQDFNDLILTCSTPQTATDYLIYGHVSYYGDGCIFNPCSRRWAVIDSQLALAEALKNSALRNAIKKLYPERVRIPIPRNPGDPPPPPFKPIVLPLEGDSALPPKQNLAITLMERAGSEPPAKPKRGAARETDDQAPSAELTSMRVMSASAPARAYDIDRVAIASIIDRFRPLCDTGPLPGVVLRFQEYDRTGAELAGAPYTGAGPRELLGACATDRNGNYIFRFSRSIADIVSEVSDDVAPGESAVVQSAPDVIVQLLDSMAPGGVAYESAPYWNIPLFRRINICIPESRVGRHPTACQGQHAIQAIGNIFIGVPTMAKPPTQPDGFGPRVGFSNSLGLTGRITARNTLGPQTRCAAWAGVLDLFACFLDQPSVTWYTIRYRPLWSSSWSFFHEVYRHPKIAKIGIPGYIGDIIGPTPRPLHVDGAAIATTQPAYKNIETDPDFVFTHRDRKAQLSTWLYAVAPGSVQFLIEGYDNAGNKVAEDCVTLYINNDLPTLDIADGITLGGSTQDNCALFTLPPGQPAAPLTVSFKADEAFGFLESYELYMYKGATGSFAVNPPPPNGSPFRLRTYVHGDDLSCTQFRGTFDDPAANAVSGYVTVDLVPTGGAWLDPGQPFCAFSLNLTAGVRRTDGYGGFGPYNATPVLVGIKT
jgi:hypothetical protein